MQRFQIFYEIDKEKRVVAKNLNVVDATNKLQSFSLTSPGTAYGLEVCVEETNDTKSKP